MDIIHQCEPITAAELREKMESPPSYSAVRATLRILENKGHVTHEKQGQRYLYRAVAARVTASRMALKRVLKTFFGGSPGQAISALLDEGDTELEEAELDQLQAMIDQARAKRGEA